MTDSVTNLQGTWVGGELHLKTLSNKDLAVLGATTGFRYMPAGTYLVATTATTVGTEASGKILTCLSTATVTLPVISGDLHGLNYTVIYNGISGDAAVYILAGQTTNYFMGCGFASGDVVYQIALSTGVCMPGDMVTIKTGINYSTPSDSCWWIQGMVGSWVSTT